MTHICIMGVAGCGKTELGQRLAARLGLPFVEGDAFHPRANLDKMRGGIPLTDADRAGWLLLLGQQLQLHPRGAVLSCSALKLAYRERLRAAVHGLRFVHVVISPTQAMQRVGARANHGEHFYPPALVHSQFDALEDPSQEEGVITLDGSAPLDKLVELAVQGLRSDGVPVSKLGDLV
jgi:gluconokinase